MKTNQLSDPSAVEREVIRLITLTIAGYMIISAIHILWIVMKPEVQEMLVRTADYITIYGMVGASFIFGVALLISKLKRNVHWIKISLACTYAYEFGITIFTAFAYQLTLITATPSLAIGVICLILWAYYRVRDHHDDYEEVV